MVIVFSHSNISGKEDKLFAKAPCEIWIYKYKNSNINYWKGGKWQKWVVCGPERPVYSHNHNQELRTWRLSENDMQYVDNHPSGGGEEGSQGLEIREGRTWISLVHKIMEAQSRRARGFCPQSRWQWKLLDNGYWSEPLGTPAPHVFWLNAFTVRKWSTLWMECSISYYPKCLMLLSEPTFPALFKKETGIWFTSTPKRTIKSVLTFLF